MRIGILINDILSLDNWELLDKYEEEILLTVKPSFYTGINAIHHLHQIKDRFIIDASFKYK